MEDGIVLPVPPAPCHSSKSQLEEAELITHKCLLQAV